MPPEDDPTERSMNAAAAALRDNPAAVAKAARSAQAGLLRPQANTGGLRFEVYLPPSLADWLLDRIERGIFADPNEAVFSIIDEHRDLERHADLRNQLLARSVEAAIAEPRPSSSSAEADKRLEELAEAPPTPAVWHKI